MSFKGLLQRFELLVKFNLKRFYIVADALDLSQQIGGLGQNLVGAGLDDAAFLVGQLGAQA